MANNSVGNLYVQLTVNNAGLAQGLNQAGVLIQQFNRISGSGQGKDSFGFLDAVKWSIGIASIHEMLGIARDFAKESYRAQIGYEKSKIAIEAMTPDLKTAAALLEQSHRLAYDTQFSSEEALKYTRRLLGAGVAADDVMPTLVALSNVAAGTGGDIDKIALAYTQVMGKGRLYAEELNQQFAEQGLGAKIFADALGLPIDKFLIMTKNGEITAEVVTQAFINMTKEGAKYNDLSKKLADVDPFEKMGKNIGETARQLVEATLKLSGFQDGMQGFNSSWNEANKALRSGEFRQGAKLSQGDAVGFLGEAFYGLKGIPALIRGDDAWIEEIKRERQHFRETIRGDREAVEGVLHKLWQNQAGQIGDLALKPKPWQPDASLVALAQSMLDSQKGNLPLGPGRSYQPGAPGGYEDFRRNVTELTEAAKLGFLKPELSGIESTTTNRRLYEAFIKLEGSLGQFSNRASLIEVGSQASYDLIARVERDSARSGNVQERIAAAVEGALQLDRQRLIEEQRTADALRNLKLAPMQLPK